MLLICGMVVRNFCMVCVIESSRRVCRYYETDEGCWRGASCPFLHLDRGEFSELYK